ncbi:glycosyltransferase involved in cell wall biosynthesis [Azospirillum fermentarium]|uniref:glycosyltransferase family 2 protein n=1 Tax=Azospirillum fermentarium TaxID=1233114 RepID=UPI0022261D2F|nr:glycosyltransferase family A protein [Azospirillum fermentarium]MCW2247479.1 glycosyltransferase involved in cell wall biosynthesis [Azospirillum fermentarium]
MATPHSPSADRVSVVIPTRFRPDLVMRAVASALAQTHPAIEVIVVIDGPDPDTEAALSAIADPRLSVLVPAANGGAARARNRGVEAATGRWVAFLDDDDHWHPGKIAAQLAGVPADIPFPIMSCRCEVVTARGTFVWPRRLSGPGDGIGDYLFVRHGLFKGETFAPTSTLMAPRDLLLRHPFPVSRFDDWEWLITAGRIDGCALVTVPEVGCVHYAESNRVTLSTCHNFDHALEWAESMQPHLSPRAYAALLLQAMGGEAAARTAGARMRILLSALAHGHPSAVGMATFALHSLMPVSLRRRVRRAVYSASSPA